jgi:hypothetical protein
MSYISRAATSIWLWICSFAAMLLHVTAFLLAIPVLAVWLLPDVLQRRGPIPLTSTPRIRRRLPRLYRDGSDVFMWMPDGTTVPLEPLEVSILVENISSVAAGAFVYCKTAIRDVDEPAE